MSDENLPPDHERIRTKCRILHKALLTHAKDKKCQYLSLLCRYLRKKITVTELNNAVKNLLRDDNDPRQTVGSFELHRSLLRNLALLTTGRQFLRNPLEDDRDLPSFELLLARCHLDAWSNGLIGVDTSVSRLLYEALKCYVKDVIQLSRILNDGKNSVTPSGVDRAVEEYSRFFHVKTE